MTTITTRSGKGSPLTNNEVDANFTNLNDDKVEASGDSMTGNLSFGDNNKAIFGAGSDLQIYHDGNNSYISDQGTGNLVLQGSNSLVLEATDGTNYIAADDGVSVFIYHPDATNQVKLSTTSTGINVTGKVVADSYDIGTLGALGSVATDRLFIATADGLGLQFDFDNSRIVPVGADGSTYNNNVSLGASGLEFKNLFLSGNATFGDNDKAIFGAGSDLQIYHDGSHSNITDVGTGNLKIKGQEVILQTGTGENSLYAATDGAVTLYHNGSAKLATTSSGIDVTGTAVVDGLTSAGDAAITGGSSGSTVLTLTSNALADTPLMVFQRTGGAVAGKLAYEDTNTAMSFGTTTSHELKLLTSNAERLQIDSSGNFIFNELSADADFRVESNNKTHALFVDAGTDKIFIGGNGTSDADVATVNATNQSTWSESATEGILGIARYNNTQSSGQKADLFFRVTTDNSSRNANGSISLVQPTTNSNHSNFQFNLRHGNGTRYNHMTLDGQAGAIFNETGQNFDFRVESDGNASMLFVDASQNSVGIGTSSPSSTYALDVVGSIRTQGTAPGLTIYETDASNQQWILGGYGGTLAARDVTGGTYPFQITTGAPTNSILIQSGGVTVNDNSADQDFRVESDSSTHALFVDAGNNHVNINTSADAGGTFNVAGDIFNDLGSDKYFRRAKYIDPRGVSDGVYGGYLLLVPYNTGGPNTGAAMEGTFIASRGNSGTGNGPSRCQVWCSGTYQNTLAWFKKEGADQFFQRLVRVTYSGTEYMALEFDQVNGGPVNGIYFDGWSLRADSNFLFMARDTEITGSVVAFDTPHPYHYIETNNNQRFNYGVTFNEAGGDHDFRVESDSNTQALLVDGGGDFVAMGNTVKNPVSGFSDQHGFGIDVTNGNTQIASDSLPLELGRTSTAGANGMFLQMRAGSTAVGALRNVDSDLVIHTTTAGHEGLRLGDGYVAPTNNSGAVSDNSCHLGLDSARFVSLKVSSGVQFGNTSASAELLDDYEEGTWTPAVRNSTLSGSVTYSAQNGYYVKVGSFVSATFYLVFTKGSLSGGTLQFTGLPFSVASLANMYPQAAILIDNLEAALTNPLLQITLGQTTGDFIQGNGSTGNHAGLSVATYIDGTTSAIQIRGTINYRAA